jgi:hypothetical protein
VRLAVAKGPLVADCMSDQPMEIKVKLIYEAFYVVIVFLLYRYWFAACAYL